MQDNNANISDKKRRRCRYNTTFPTTYFWQYQYDKTFLTMLIQYDMSDDIFRTTEILPRNVVRKCQNDQDKTEKCRRFWPNIVTCHQNWQNIVMNDILHYMSSYREIWMTYRPKCYPTEKFREIWTTCHLTWQMIWDNTDKNLNFFWDDIKMTWLKMMTCHPDIKVARNVVHVW